MKIAKQTAGSYAASWKIKDWTLLKGRHPPKQKKKAIRVEAGNVEAPAPNDTENKTKQLCLTN
jgi:hypothetical protein